ncbi:hypothetical protein ACOME3_006193 [Neoechinorhynchus agilis]
MSAINVNFEACIEWIRQNGYRNVLLQLDSKFNSNTEGIIDRFRGDLTECEEIVVLCPTCPSCCIDVNSAIRLKANALIIVGNCFCPTKIERIPIFHIRHKIDCSIESTELLVEKCQLYKDSTIIVDDSTVNDSVQEALKSAKLSFLIMSQIGHCKRNDYLYISQMPPPDWLHLLCANTLRYLNTITMDVCEESSVRHLVRRQMRIDQLRLFRRFGILIRSSSDKKAVELALKLKKLVKKSDSEDNFILYR